MAGYLTKVMILVKTEEWLGRLVTALETKKAALLRERRPFSDTEEGLLALARRARPYLRVEASSSPSNPLAPARIENHVGEGISKYAYVGAIGPDFPGAGYVFTLRHSWVAETMHKGAPRRAWVQAGTTEFILKLLDNVRERSYFTEDQRRAMMSYAIGHLSSVASDVTINPFIYAFVESTTNQDAGSRDKVNRQEFEVEMDAKVAQGFFQRRDMKTGQDWEDYFLEKGDYEREIEWLTDVYLEAFRRTYRGEDPQELLCGVPASDCPTQHLSRDFLIDGYRNTTAWALDVGYDQTPWFRAILFFLWLGGGMVVVWQFWSATEFFDTMGNSLFDWNKTEVEAVRAANLASWNSGGFFANERAWFDALDVSYTWSGFMLLPFGMLLSGALGMNGLFGQGTTGLFSRPGGVIAFKLIKYAYTFGAKQLLNLFATSFWHHPATRWVRFVIDQTIDAVQQFVINKPSVGGGSEISQPITQPVRITTFHSSTSAREGYKLDYHLWFVQMGLFGAYFFSAMFTFGLKSARSGSSGGSRETGYSGLDFAFGALVPLVYLGFFLGLGGAEKIVVKGVTGSDWPSDRTNEIDSYLPVVTSGDTKSFDAAHAEARPVRLMRDDALVTLPDGKKHYPEDSGTAPGNARDAADEEHRRVGSDETTATFKLAGLFDKAAQFSALLAMAAVNYDTASPAMKEQVKAIFKDWNLDYLAVSQWNELMTDDTSLLGAVSTWFDDITNGRFNTSDTVVERIGRDFAFQSLSGRLDGDFDHDASTAVGSGANRGGRLQRPGAILLANLDLDDALPDPLPSPLPNRNTQLDAIKDDVINAANDADELSPLEVRKPAPAAGGLELALRVHAADAERVRVFMGTTTGAATTWARCLGAQATGAGTTEFTLPNTAPDPALFKIEARTLAGDPRLPAPSVAAPNAPAPVTPTGTVGQPLSSSRAPSDVWIELLHKDRGAEVQSSRDVALYTIAPYMLLSSRQPTERVYIAYYRGVTGNHATVDDLVEALKTALGAANVTTQQLPTGAYVPHQPVRPGHPQEAKRLYILDGDAYRLRVPDPSAPGGERLVTDQWVQDAFELGYCWAPHASMHVVVHCPRYGEDNGLGPFVLRELPAADRGLFNSFSRKGDSQNFGGNIEVSPPVNQPTDALPMSSLPAGSSLPASLTTDAAGVPVPAQARAPFGKIIVGEGKRFLFALPLGLESGLDAGGAAPSALVTALQDRASVLTGSPVTLPALNVTVRSRGQEWLLMSGDRLAKLIITKTAINLSVSLGRILDPDFKAFLETQKVQPVISIDTSWLKVGHVDEIISFVRSNTPKGFKLLMASPTVAKNILNKASDLSDPTTHPITDLFRGKQWIPNPRLMPRVAHGFTDASISVFSLLLRAEATNDEIQSDKLQPIKERLLYLLGLEESDVLHLPVYFDEMPLHAVATSGTTAAFTPDLVNLLEVDGHVMVPRPFGPRMSAADVVTVLTDPSVGLTGLTAAQLTPLVGHFHWARGGTAAGDIEILFNVPTNAVRRDARNTGKFNAAGQVVKEWDKVWVPENNVDLFEAYTKTVLEGIGLTVHFIDDWDVYHRADGEVHCGTNAVRTPPERASGYTGPYWWQHYS